MLSFEDAFNNPAANVELARSAAADFMNYLITWLPSLDKKFHLLPLCALTAYCSWQVDGYDWDPELIELPVDAPSVEFGFLELLRFDDLKPVLSRLRAGWNPLGLIDGILYLYFIQGFALSELERLARENKVMPSGLLEISESDFRKVH